MPFRNPIPFSSHLLLLMVLCVWLLPVVAAPGENRHENGNDPIEHRRREAELKEHQAKEWLQARVAATVNQEQYDVHYYDLDLTLDPAAKILTGTVTLVLEVVDGPMGSIDLDLQSALTVTGASLGVPGGDLPNHQHTGDVVTVVLDHAYNTGDAIHLTLEYTGNPAGRSFDWGSAYGQTAIWTLSEPFGAREWWPCKDLNSDKADSVSIRCTVPSDLIAASNGLLVSDVTQNGWRTFHWKTNYPIATYLVSLAVHPFHRYSHWYTPRNGGDPMEVQYYVFNDPAHIALVESLYPYTVPMIDLFANHFGEYPFVNEKYGHADIPVGAAMEHQTLSSMGGWSMDVISHELGHQWWGDMITCDDFRHIWLNEGFATWCEAYWAEQEFGRSTYDEYMDSAAYWGAGTIFVEHPETDNIFDVNLSYNKGSWVVHMLRGVLGDDDFFAGIAEYRTRHQYGSATTEELRDALEDVSGIDLDAFFQQWIYGEFFPVYRYSWRPVAGRDEIEVTIDQIQENTGLFEMPIQLRIETENGTFVSTVQNSASHQVYPIPVSGEVSDVQLDPERWILCGIEKAVGNAPLDQGVLLVNAVPWSTASLALESAYQDSTFRGNFEITFWDTDSEPASGYPPSLPTPLGHGPVPSDVIADYSTVIWVGSNQYAWEATPIHSYLESGGNVLLCSNDGSTLLDPYLTDYLGVTWEETDATLIHCLAEGPGLVDIPFIGPQNGNDVYRTAVDPGSLLLRCDYGFSQPRGLGAWVAPPGGGIWRPDGARLVHLGGRPYYLDHEALRSNIQYILENCLLEPYAPASATPQTPPHRETAAVLGTNFPNPFNPQTIIPFSIARGTRIQLGIYDARGRRVRRLIDEALPAGDHQVRWDGKSDAGRNLASGTYFARLRTAGGTVRTRSLVLLR